MQHCDDESLAAIALGEPLSAADGEHAATCERCASEVEALRATLTRAGLGAGVELVAPPARVWAGIEGEIAAEDDAPAGAVVPLTRARGRRERRVPGHTFRGWVVGAAAAVGVVIGGVGVALLGLGGDGSGGDTVVAQAALADLATEADAGTARVEQRADGTEVLVVDTVYDASADGALEVWLIDPDVIGMVSVGFLTGDHGEFEIPAGYDVASFPIVDISVEPADGDPTHSGDSITRGVLET
ncbi:anti-sigma factor [Demequina silvatica]|uniref:anti-sigma factor n=1 Tax=Demequina silvatica TaxID=1638988 RepID=UPI0007824509|nr:anti-sigma factor [Demequina silvatica]